MTVEGWYGQPLERPLRDMGEYVGIVRAILAGRDPPQGERLHSSFHFMGYQPRPDIPVCIGALSPRMLRLAGAIGDGVVLWLCNPDYVRDVVIPEVTKGRELAGKDLQGFDVGMAKNDPATAVGAISDRFLETLTAIGTAEEAGATIRRYQEAGLTSPCLGGVPGTDFDATLEQLAHLTG